jgi:trans-aconitate methyltransferase
MGAEGQSVRPLSYQPLERLPLPRPVNRSAFLVEQCRGRRVLDLGCYDETALVKRDVGEWLHGRIADVATSTLGVDNSAGLPAEGIATGPTSRIIRGDVTALASVLPPDADPEVIVAGELLEHLEDPTAFLRQIKTLFPGRRLIATTPNATQLSNVLLALMYRESNHKDHLNVLSYKTLTTLCTRAGFESWRLVPYHVQYLEMALRSTGTRRRLVRTAQLLVGGAESAFPFLSSGYIVDVTRI